MHRKRLVLTSLVLAVSGTATAGAFAAAEVSAATPKKITVTGAEYAFAFSSKKVRKGVPVTLTFVNKGTEVHDLKFTGVKPQFKILVPGGRQTLKLTFKKAGRYQYLCTIGEHALKGMTGTLLVKP